MVKFCNKCGKELKDNDVFCPNCGNKVEEDVFEAKPVEGDVTCPVCGCKVEAGKEYCPVCGALVRNRTQEAQRYTSGPMYAQNQKVNAFGLVGFILSIISCCIDYFAPVSLVLGIIGLIQINKGKGRGKGFAIAAIVIGAIATVLLIIYLYIQFAHPEIFEQYEQLLEDYMNGTQSFRAFIK